MNIMTRKMFAKSSAPKVCDIYTSKPDARSDNKIKNTKYTLFTFVPSLLIQQFQSFTSVYFIFIMAAQYFNIFSISSFSASFFPWLFVLIISMVNEGLDDYKRYTRDKESNSGVYSRWTKKGLVPVTSADIKVGDIIMIQKGERVPADCVILKVEDVSGEVFIRTDQMDGETDWKRRVSPPETQLCPLESLLDLHLVAEPSHKDIYSFTAALDLPARGVNGDELAPRLSVALGLDNTVWANTVVTTTGVLGLVVYTGHSTRAMMNTYKPRTKSGVMESELDFIMFILVVLSVITSLIFMTLSTTKTLSIDGFVTFIRFLILFSYVIPISLKVTLNLARFWYMRQIHSNEPEVEGIIVRSTSMQEELGRVSYLLTDKTGTLTKNEMVMKKLHLGTVYYSTDNGDEIRGLIADGALKSLKRRSGIKTRGIRMYELFEALSLCHSVMPVILDNGEINYQASSPDELAIVEYAATVGFRLIRRDRSSIVVKTPMGEKTYILETFPFNSDTKRMGIIVKRETDGVILFFEKGADVAMRRVLKENDWVEEETDNMARDGLRTLLIGRKVMKEIEYNSFAKRYHEAKITLVSRNEKMLEEQESIEHDLEILGLTGVEDKLQENVKQSLENLRNAGIKVWMLTGDKIETGISIALSSRLLDKSDRYLVISGCKDPEEMETHIRSLRQKSYNALIIDGVSIGLVIDSFLTEFISAVQNLNCLVGCRYTPTQKATMAAALKKVPNEIVCCIGDGGNDVSMITEAHVGIGIEGKEGNQASLAADFSIRSFSQICDLLFYHGRRCYKNSSSVAHIIIHRGTIITIVQAIFSALLNFTPISIFQGLTIAFIIGYSFLPLLALIDSYDITRSIALRYPELYLELRNAHLLSFYSFLVYNFNSLYQAFVIMRVLCPEHTDFKSLDSLVYVALIVNENIMVFFTIERVTLLYISLFFISIILCILSSVIFSKTLNIRAISEQCYLVIFACFLAALMMFIRNIYRGCIKPESYKKLGSSHP